MYLGPEQTVTGNDDIDILKAVQTANANLPLQQKLERITHALRIAPPSSLPGQEFSIDAGLGFAALIDRPQACKYPLQEISMIGRVSLDEPLKYLLDEDIPVDSLAVKVVDPLFIGFDAKGALGYTPEAITLPVVDIYQFRPASEAV